MITFWVGVLLGFALGVILSWLYTCFLWKRMIRELQDVKEDEVTRIDEESRAIRRKP